MKIALNEIVYQVDIPNLKMTERTAYRIDKSNDNQDMVMLKCGDDDSNVIIHVDGFTDWELFTDRYTAFRYFTITCMQKHKNVRESIKHDKLKLKDEMGARVLASIKESHPELFV